MKPNPGGIITGRAIVDREAEIAAIWNALQGQSVVLASERRYTILKWWKVNRG